MNRCSLFCAFALGLISRTAAAETTDQMSAPSNQNQDEVVDIPLDEVWAFDIPGTIDISKVVPDSHKIGIEQIRHSLTQKPLKDRKSIPAFAVRGNVSEALVQANEMLVAGKKPVEAFRTHDEISFVFFS